MYKRNEDSFLLEKMSELIGHDKFIFAYLNEKSDGVSYLPNTQKMCDMERCYLIDALKNHRICDKFDLLNDD